MYKIKNYRILVGPVPSPPPHAEFSLVLYSPLDKY